MYNMHTCVYIYIYIYKSLNSIDYTANKTIECDLNTKMWIVIFLSLEYIPSGKKYINIVL